MAHTKKCLKRGIRAKAKALRKSIAVYVPRRMHGSFCAQGENADVNMRVANISPFPFSASHSPLGSDSPTLALIVRFLRL